MLDQFVFPERESERGERERTLWKTFVQSNCAYTTLFVYKQHGKCAQHAAINVLHVLELEMK